MMYSVGLGYQYSDSDEPELTTVTTRVGSSQSEPRLSTRLGSPRVESPRAEPRLKINRYVQRLNTRFASLLLAVAGISKDGGGVGLSGAGTFRPDSNSNSTSEEDENDRPPTVFDALPVISQIKSAFQYLFDDSKQAIKTQQKFVLLCPVVSQWNSFLFVLDGKLGKAWRTQEYFFSFWYQTAVDFAEGTPGLGHVIAALAYMAGDREKRDRAMKSASRTSGVILGAMAGACVGGPAGAAAGAVYGGILMDLLITGADSIIHNKYRPHGYVAALNQIWRGEATTGDVFDILCGIGVEAGMAYFHAEQSARARTVVFDEHQMNPHDIRFSQTSVAGQNADSMSSVMSENQQKGKMGFPMPAIDVVEMPDGKYTALDNRRLIAAREANVSVFARKIKADTRLPLDQAERFPGCTTYGEAVQRRVSKQKPKSFARENPYGFKDAPKKSQPGAGGGRGVGGHVHSFFHQNAAPLSEAITSVFNMFNAQRPGARGRKKQ